MDRTYVLSSVVFGIAAVGCAPAAPEPTVSPVISVESPARVQPVPEPTSEPGGPAVIAEAPPMEDTEPVPIEAHVDGKYAELIKVVYVPEDRKSYGEYDDYGWWGPGEWAGEMQPEGYWVYVYPNWYIWRRQNGR